MPKKTTLARARLHAPAFHAVRGEQLDVGHRWLGQVLSSVPCPGRAQLPDRRVGDRVRDLLADWRPGALPRHAQLAATRDVQSRRRGDLGLRNVPQEEIAGLPRQGSVR